MIASTSVTSAGEALREIDNSGIIRSDPFVLVSGDVISNVQLAPIISLHKERKKKDPDCVMTMVFKRVCSTNDRLSSIEDDLVIAVDKETQQIVKYENMPSDGFIEFNDPKIFNEHPKVVTRYDLIDCHIDICSPKMLLEIAGNYDYQDIRKDYVHNEVQNKELGSKFYGYELPNSVDYAAQVHCWKTYAAVSKDIIRRWLHPLVLDRNWNMSSKTTFNFIPGFIYKEANVQISRSCVIGDDCVVGEATEIGDNATLVNTTIGRNCVIGKGVTIDNSIIWDNVTIQDGATISFSILCSGVKLGARCIVPRGVVLSYSVEIDEDHRVPEFSRITRENLDTLSFADDWGDDSSSKDEEIQVASETSPGHVGIAGKGVSYEEPSEHLEDEERPG